jgi:SAM-dependent methyltransferase
MLQKIRRELFVRTHKFYGFLDEDALAINEARLNHLATLGLPIDGKSVLEVGAGIGLLTGFFEERGCQVLSTDARPDNVAEIKRRNPHRQVAVLDLEHPDEVDNLGRFDLVFCYGTLYHLTSPEPALEALSRVAALILLETCLTPGREDASPHIDEPLFMNQAVTGVGSRPTRTWVLNRLIKYWGHGYIAKTQPEHPDFPTDWNASPVRLNTRAVFVGSRTLLANPLLTATELEEPERTG